MRKKSLVLLYWLPVIHYLFLTNRWVDRPTIIHIPTGIIEEKNLLGWEKVSIFPYKSHQMNWFSTTNNTYGFSFKCEYIEFKTRSYQK